MGHPLHFAIWWRQNAQNVDVIIEWSLIIEGISQSLFSDLQEFDNIFVRGLHIKDCDGLALIVSYYKFTL